MATEVFNNIGESELHSEGENFFRRYRKEGGNSEEFVSSEKIESITKPGRPVTNAKKEFLKELEDESLTIDTCSKLTHEWGKR
jgi:hypothetical protein